MQTPHRNSEILDRLPPQNLDAEKGVLGSLLLDSVLCEEVADLLRPSDFYADANQRLYRHLTEMHATGIRIDSTLLLERLRASGDLEAIGGTAYLAEVVHAVPYAANAVYYAKIVRDKATLRAIIHAATGMLQAVWEPSAESEAVLEAAERSLTAIHTDTTDMALVDATQASLRASDKIDAIYRRERQAGILTGMEAYDQMFGGIFGGELTVIAARLGVGKTALASQWVDDIAARSHLTYFASLEMDAAEITTRILCTIGNVSGAKIRNASLTDTDVSQLSAAARGFAARSIWFDERPRLRVSDIRRATRPLLRQGLQAVFVDYLQRVKPENSRDPREQQVAQIARDFKELARELKVPVVVLAQLNRAKGAIDGTGGAEDLRESDAVGQEADVVARIDVKGKEPNEEYWLRVVKNRNGPKGKIRLAFNADLTRFEPFQVPVESRGNYEHDFSDHDGRNNSEW